MHCALHPYLFRAGVILCKGSDPIGADITMFTAWDVFFQFFPILFSIQEIGSKYGDHTGGQDLVVRVLMRVAASGHGGLL